VGAVRAAQEEPAQADPRAPVDDGAVGDPRAAALALDPELGSLTPRERQVLRLIALGYTYRGAATDLGISAKTVETHVSSVLRKLQLTNRYQLSHWASQRCLD
jgi:DNA-binding NarL/FixJ family response regulator